MPSNHETAHELAAAGISVVPVLNDGSKRPYGVWKRWQTEIATTPMIDAMWPTNTDLGVGVITGRISGNLEMLEVEGRAVHNLSALTELATASGIGEIWSRVSVGWLEQSPSGGLHWFYRLENVVPGNTKLANAADHTTLAETRGEGGFVVVAPTAGTAHETGLPWVRLTGGPSTIPTLTDDEREALHSIFATLDQTPPAPDIQTINSMWSTTQPQRDGDVSPGDDYEAQVDWSDILTPHGWTLIHARGRERFWTRPGKNVGISATTGHADDRDRLYVFTSSTIFNAETPYTKFGAYAHLNHNGDYKAAASALAAKGFGKRTEPTFTPTPTTTATVGNLALAPVTHIDKAPSKVEAAAVLAETDHANALRVIAAHGDHIRYAHDRGRWLSWDGHRWQWQPPSGGKVREITKAVLADLPEEYTSTFRKRSLSAKGIADTLTMMGTHPDIAIEMKDLDAHPWELNTPGGIVNLRTAETMPSDPTRLHTKVTAHIPNKDHKRDVWDGFLEATFKSAEVIDYMQRLAGYSFIGQVLEHVLPFCYGEGGNGKSVFLDTLLKIGGDYATSAPSGFLMSKMNQAHETEIARLTGARFVICSEVNEGDKFDEAKVKELTGGDALTARFMRQDHFTFTPTHHLWLTGNHRPAVESGGYAFWRRLRLIPFNYKVTEEKKVDDLQGILNRTEGPAILAWLIEGAALYVKNGLAQPEIITSATSDYQQSQDTVGKFLEERCYLTTGPTALTLTTSVKDVRDAYEKWCSDVGEKALAGRPFADQLKHHGVLVGRDAPRPTHGGSRVYGGITIRPEEPVTQDGDTDRTGEPWR